MFWFRVVRNGTIGYRNVSSRLEIAFDSWSQACSASSILCSNGSGMLSRYFSSSSKSALSSPIISVTAFLLCFLVAIFNLTVFIGCPVCIHRQIVEAMLTPSDAHLVLKAATMSASIVNLTCVIVLDMAHQRSLARATPNKEFGILEPVGIPF